MANTLRIKRRPSSGSAGAPSSLFNGELAFNESDNILYYGYGSGVGGAATSFPSIGGSGAYSLRGGSNATGTWPISVDGNSATVTNGVYTTGNQNVGGIKRFTSQVEISGALSPYLIFKSANAGNYGNIVFDGVNYDGALQSSYISSSTGNMEIAHGQKIQLNSALEVKAANTAGNSVGYFAVFDSNPNSSLTTLKSVSKDQILDDIGAATSGLDITAGSGLVGGGTLSQNRRFDIGQGDGITVSADSIAVDSTVVRTTGTQTINGSKTFGNQTAFNSGISIGDTVNYLTGTALVINWGDGGGQLASFINNASQLNNSINLNAVTTFDNVSYNSLFPFIINPTGYNGYGAVTQGFWRGETIEINKGGTGRTSYSNGQLLIGSGTSLAANTLTQGSNVQITNGSGTITIAATGLALSSRTLTAGSGLVGGGDLSSDKTFNIGQGDGISVSADSIAVDNTVVRTTGNQDIVGAKSFYESSNTQIIFSTADDVIKAKAPNTSDQTYYFVGLDGGGSPPSSTSADRSLVSRSTSQVKTDLSLNNVTNDAQIKKLASTSGGYVPTWNGTTGDALNIGYSVETTLTGGTGALPRADAVKTYVDSMIGSGIATNDAMIFKGAIDCSTNPNYPAADRGWTYKVSVAGRIGGASGPVVEVNDTLICSTDGTSAGTHASVGSNWVILQTNIADASILVTGPSSATSGNIAMFDGSTGKIIKDGGFLASDIARLSASQTFTGTNSFKVINAGYQVNGDPAFTIYNDSDDITFRVMSGGSVTDGTWSATTIAADKGGTGQSSYTIGDLLYANTTTTLAKLADVATGNVLLAGGVSTAPSWGKVGLTTHVSGTLPVANGGTNQTSYTDGQLLIGNSTGNTLSKATLTEGTGLDITNGAGSITISHEDTSTLTGAQGSNGIASITVDGMGHVTAVTTATYLTAATVCAAITDCTLDGGTF